MKMLGVKIRRLRELRNYTQEYMATRLDINQNTYSRYEKGEIEPKLERLKTIAEVLEVPTEELLRPDPIVIQVSHNEVANGGNLVHHHSNVPRDLFEKLADRYEERVKELERMNQRLLDLLERFSGDKG
jgi:transcriptional regulator with XRE-family HTH domain